MYSARGLDPQLNTLRNNLTYGTLYSVGTAAPLVLLSGEGGFSLLGQRAVLRRGEKLAAEVHYYAPQGHHDGRVDAEIVAGEVGREVGQDRAACGDTRTFQNRHHFRFTD